MDAFPESPEERQALLDRHSTIRAEIDAVYEKLVENLPDEDILAAAKTLGLWRRGRLTASDQEDFIALFDLALFGNAETPGVVGRLIEMGGVEGRPAEIVQALSDSRFSIFEVVGIVPELGVELHDRIRDARTFVLAPAFVTTPEVELNSFVAGRLVDLDDLTVFASNGLSLHEELAKSFATTLNEGREALAEGEDEEGAQQNWLATTVLRGVMYAKHGAPQTPARSTKVGRNDPCTCGSGKKYKKCCGA